MVLVKKKDNIITKNKTKIINSMKNQTIKLNK